MDPGYTTFTLLFSYLKSATLWMYSTTLSLVTAIILPPGLSSTSDTTVVEVWMLGAERMMMKIYVI